MVVNELFLFSIIRKAGTYGDVPVDWELTSDDGVTGQVAETFNTTRGTIMFGDGVKMKNITLQVRTKSLLFSLTCKGQCLKRYLKRGTPV